MAAGCRRRREQGAALLAAAVAVVLPVASPASSRVPADPPTGRAPPDDRGVLTFVFENDLFYDLDRRYTNGVELSWTTGEAGTPEWLRRLARALPTTAPDARIRATFTLGQAIYTPDDIGVRNPPRDERPYAGWLFGSVGLTAERDDVLDQIQLGLGVVGPWSLAAEAQAFVHDIVGADDPRGWSTQIRNEPAILLLGQRSWRGLAAGEVLGLGVDLTPFAGLALGNVFTHGEAGLTLRIGRDLPADFGPPRIEPSIAGSAFFRPHGRFGWYLFASGTGRAVVRNIFLDGNSFRDSRSVDKRRFVADLQAGLAVTLGRVRIAYTHVLRTPEFDGQVDDSQFGAFGLSVRF